MADKVKLSSIKSDLAKESDGAAIPIPDWAGVTMTVRSFDYAPYRTARALLLQKIQRKYNQELSAAREDETYEGFGKLYAEYILLRFDGFDIEYSPEFAAQALPSKEWKALHAAVEYAANKMSKVEAEYIEGSGKN